MQSSYNVIKSQSVLSQGGKIISTDYSPNLNPNIVSNRIANSEESSESVKFNLESYENLAKTMIEKARRQSESMLSKAFEEAQAMERDAFQKGHQNGYQTGYEEGKQQGYNEAYEQNIERAQAEAKAMIDNANNILFSAKQQYEQYFAEKQKDIISLSLRIAETVLKRQLLKDDGIDEMVFAAIEQSRKAKTIIIKTNSMHVDSLKAKADDWKERLALNAEIFVIADETVGEGNAVIEKENGLMIIGIDTALESIKQVLE